MRLLFVIESLGRGGAEQALVNLLPALQQRGHQCEVAALWPPYDLSHELKTNGIKVHHLHLQRRWNLPQGLLKLLRLCHRRRFDVIHAHLFFAGIYTALTRPFLPRLRRVVTFHNLDYDSYPANTAPRRARKFLDKQLMRRCINGYSAVSRAAAHHYAKHLGLEAEQIAVMPNAFPVDTLRPQADLDRAAVRQHYNIELENFVLALPARLVHEKGHRFLFEALELLRQRGLQPTALIIGSGPLAADLHAMVNDRNVQQQVNFLGALPHAELVTVLQSVDTVVLPSTHEGFGLAAAEAMALEVPVLATRVGGLVDLVDENNSGLLVAPADSAALVDGIAKLMADPELRRRLAHAGRQRIITHFSADVVAAQWEAFYTALLKKAA